MKTKFSILLLMLSCSIFATKGQKQYTLQECIDIALENNRNIKQQALNKQQKEIAYNQARADLLPNLNASTGQNFIFGRSIGLNNMAKF